MTDEEALELARKEYKCRKRSLTDCGLDCEECPIYVSDSDFVIALGHAVEALEKQIPKTPEQIKGLIYDDYDGEEWKSIVTQRGKCPLCGENVEMKYKSCPSCGQLLDWSEVE